MVLKKSNGKKGNNSNKKGKKPKSNQVLNKSMVDDISTETLLKTAIIKGSSLPALEKFKPQLTIQQFSKVFIEGLNTTPIPWSGLLNVTKLEMLGADDIVLMVKKAWSCKKKTIISQLIEDYPFVLTSQVLEKILTEPYDVELIKYLIEQNIRYLDKEVVKTAKQILEKTKIHNPVSQEQPLIPQIMNEDIANIANIANIENIENIANIANTAKKKVELTSPDILDPVQLANKGLEEDKNTPLQTEMPIVPTVIPNLNPPIIVKNDIENIIHSGEKEETTRAKIVTVNTEVSPISVEPSSNKKPIQKRDNNSNCNFALKFLFAAAAFSFLALIAVSCLLFTLPTIFAVSGVIVSSTVVTTCYTLALASATAALASGAIALVPPVAKAGFFAASLPAGKIESPRFPSSSPSKQ